MRTLIVVGLALGLVVPALAAEPEGCARFAWPIDGDRAALTAPDRTAVESGSSRTISTKAITLALKPIDAAALPMPPEGKRAAEGYAGYIKVAAPEKPGSYTVSLSSRVWIDVIQDGQYVNPTAIGGARECAGIRKSVQFDLAAKPFVVQVSRNEEPSMALVVRPSD